MPHRDRVGRALYTERNGYHYGRSAAPIIVASITASAPTSPRPATRHRPVVPTAAFHLADSKRKPVRAGKLRRDGKENHHSWRAAGVRTTTPRVSPYGRFLASRGLGFHKKKRMMGQRSSIVVVEAEHAQGAAVPSATARTHYSWNCRGDSASKNSHPQATSRNTLVFCTWRLWRKVTARCACAAAVKIARLSLDRTCNHEFR